jgi:hypothetical protein
MQAMIEDAFLRDPVVMRPEDVESAARRALLARAVYAYPGERQSTGNAVRLCGAEERDRAEALVSELSSAPLGSPLPWLICVELLGTTIEYRGKTSNVLEPYRETLRAHLVRLADRQPADFLRWLSLVNDADLDRHLRAALDGLRAAALLALGEDRTSLATTTTEWTAGIVDAGAAVEERLALVRRLRLLGNAESIARLEAALEKEEELSVRSAAWDALLSLRTDTEILH